MTTPRDEQESLEAEVVAMQFAAGRGIADLALEWEHDATWVEAAVRRALLEQIPQRVGGLKPSRDGVRARRSEEAALLDELQGSLEWMPCKQMQP